MMSLVCTLAVGALIKILGKIIKFIEISPIIGNIA
jgi:hypothetical protein